MRGASGWPGVFDVHGVLRRTLRRLPHALIERGLHPGWFGYRWIQHESLREYFARRSGASGDDASGPGPAADPLPKARAAGHGAASDADGAGESLTVVHPAGVASNPLPRNVRSRDELPDDAGWWGFSFRDVPTRRNGETVLARLPDCRLAFDEDAAGTFHVGILDADDRALELREIRFRPGHARMMRRGKAAARMERATWILERSFDNYSHWLTAHLSKLCLLRERDALDDVVLPPERNAFIESSLRMLGIDAADHPTFDPTRPLRVDELTLVGIDRFRPEALRAVREAIAPAARRPGGRRIFVSRAHSPRRRLVDEERVWDLLRAAGFERVVMEDLAFEEQVDLMQQASVLCGPHGAGLTNMMFCPPGTQIIEIADPGFPNPNFYALACAMQHGYWWVRARSLGDGHPLERDMQVDGADVAAVLTAIERL